MPDVRENDDGGDGLIMRRVNCCRLASIQDKRPVSVPLVSSKQQLTEDDRRSLMMSITALLPDHNARLRALQVTHCSSLLYMIIYARTSGDFYLSLNN